MQGREDGSLVVTAFDRSQRELKHYESVPTGDGGVRWSVGDAAARVEGQFDAPQTSASGLEVSGQINGVPFRSVIGPDGVPQPTSDTPVGLTAEQEALLTQFQPAVQRGDGLLALAGANDQDPLEGRLGCLVAGFGFALALPLCLGTVSAPGCLPAGTAGGYIANHCTDSW